MAAVLCWCSIYIPLRQVQVHCQMLASSLASGKDSMERSSVPSFDISRVLAQLNADSRLF